MMSRTTLFRLSLVMVVASLAVVGCKKKAAPAAEPAKASVPEPGDPPEPKGAPEPEPTPAPEPKGPAPARFMPDKGVMSVILPGEQEPTDLVLGGDIRELAGNAGIEIGEHGAKVDKPIGFTLGGHEFAGDGRGKLARIRLALADLKQGLDVEGTTVPHDLKFEEIRKVVSDCAEPKVLLGATHQSCLGGKLLFLADKEQKVFIQLEKK